MQPKKHTFISSIIFQRLFSIFWWIPEPYFHKFVACELILFYLVFFFLGIFYLGLALANLRFHTASPINNGGNYIYQLHNEQKNNIKHFSVIVLIFKRILN